MKIAVLGTGVVGQTIGSRLVEVGHEVKMGSRTADNEKAVEWVQKNGDRASQGTFSDAARFGEIVFVCTKGEKTLEALTAAGAENIQSKIVVDVTNPLVMSQSGLPDLDPQCINTNSLGEEIQKMFPDAQVVKTLNTMWCGLMVDPGQLNNGDHHVFISGNHSEAKATVLSILGQFGWKQENIIDLGDITTARGTEMFLPLWLRIMKSQNAYRFNIKLVWE